MEDMLIAEFTIIVSLLHWIINIHSQPFHLRYNRSSQKKKKCPSSSHLYRSQDKRKPVIAETCCANLCAFVWRRKCGRPSRPRWDGSSLGCDEEQRMCFVRSREWMMWWCDVYLFAVGKNIIFFYFICIFGWWIDLFVDFLSFLKWCKWRQWYE